MIGGVRIACLMLLMALTGGIASLSGQQSRCADCHFANLRPSFATHLRDWDVSAHSRAGIGCERCHGGNATTFEPFLAHQGILHWSNPASPVHQRNVPGTCGVCHAGPYVAFQKSRHFELLRGGAEGVPTCTTCHGNAGEDRPSPRALESTCQSCHRADRPAGHPEHPAMGRLMLEGIRETRGSLEEARRMIRRITDQARRARLEAAAQQVEVPLVQAAQSGHAFVYDDLEERLDTARQRLAALFEDLVNPSRP
jgi:uncharacterized membrane protein